MICAKVFGQDGEQRLLRIEDGLSTLGSALECTLVLSDAGIQPHHLELKLEVGVLSVRCQADGGAALMRKGKRAPVHIGVDEWLVCNDGDSIAIDALRIVPIVLASAEAAFEPGAGRRPLLRWAVPLSAGALVCGGLVFAILPPEKDAIAAHAPVSENVSASRVTETAIAAPQQLDENAVKAAIVGAGYQPENLEKLNDRWKAALHVADNRAADEARQTLNALPVPLDAQIFSDSSIASAVRIILENLHSDVTLTNVQGGNVFLDGANKEDRQKIVDDITSDVSGVNSVYFDHGSDDLEAVKSLVSGLWSGGFPYVVLKDQRVVRPGEFLTADAQLEDVVDNGLIVNMSGERKKVFFP